LSTRRNNIKNHDLKKQGGDKKLQTVDKKALTGLGRRGTEGRKKI